MPRLLRRILLITASVFALLTAALVVVAYAYEDEVKAKLVEELNAHLKAPLYQNGIELTLIKRFPQASLRFKDVLIKEVRTDGVAPDTLLSAQDLYLEFGLFSLLTGDYTVHDLHGKDVRLYAGHDGNGAANWDIWRTDSTATGSTAFALKKVTFDGIGTRYRDARSGSDIRTASDKLALRARFRPDGSTLDINGDVLLLTWRDTDGVYLHDRRADVKLALAFGGPDGAFRITKGELQTGNTPLNVTLAVTKEAKGRSLDLRANGFNLRLADLVALLPDGLHARLRHYGLSGEADVAIHYGGPLEGEGPALSAGITVRDGKLKETRSGVAFSQVQGQLSLDLTPKGTPRKLIVKGFSAQASSGTIGGTIELNGLTNAKLKADIHGDLALADLMRFARVDTLEQVEGRLKANAKVSGKLRDMGDIRPGDLRALTITGTAELRDASLKLKGVRHRVTGLDATLALKGNDAQVNGLHCAVQGNAIELSGTLRNLMPYLLFPDQHLTIAAEGRSPKLDLASLLSPAGAGTTTASAYAFKLPALIDLDLKADVDELVMEDFSAQAIQGTVRLQDRVLSIAPLSFRTAGGAVSGDLRLDGRVSGGYPLAIAANVDGMDVSALFAEFKDFGQGFLTHHQLKGRSHAQLTLTAAVMPDFSLDQDRLHCVADVTVDNGELNGHPSLLQVADYLQQNKLVSPFVDTDELRTKLKHVTFARLENRIEIKDRQVFLPQMLVKSSVMDIEVSGTHGFDGAVDDHLNFRLGDLFRTADSGHDEFGPIIDDGTGLRIFLHMYGTTNALRFGNDGALAATRRKEKLKQGTAELKSIIKGVFSGESKAQPVPTAAQGKVTVDWAGDGTPEQPARTSATRPKKGLGRLLQKDAKDDEEGTIIIE
ncbi:MAG: AsmA-like C-terminal region-containing protein [Flavobacteriales bacterium]